MVHRRLIPRPRIRPRPDVAAPAAGPDVPEPDVAARERDPSRRARRASDEADAYLAAHRRHRRERRPSVR